MYSNRALSMPFCGALIAGAMVVALPGSAAATTATVDLASVTKEQLAQSLVGPGVTISNVTHVGDAKAAGSFTGGSSSIGFASGVVLSSGDIADTVGPNTSDDTTTSFYSAGDSDLATAAGKPTYDASVLEFDFTANASTVFFRYAFGSEEYLEWVGSSYNDVFGFFVNGVNCATVPDGTGGTTAVAVNSVNPGMNANLYRDNPVGSGNIDISSDGLTVVLTCMAPVNVGVNHMKLAIADASDTTLDSAVWLEQGSLSTTPPSGTGKVTGGGSFRVGGGSTTLGTTVIQDEQGLRGNLQVNDHTGKARFHGYDVDNYTVNGRTAQWSGDGRWNGKGGYRYSATITDNRNGASSKKGSPDTVELVISDSSGNTVWSSGGTKSLTGGNMTLHS